MDKEAARRRCFRTRAGGAIGGLIAAIPVGLELGTRIAELFKPALAAPGALVGAVFFGIIGGIGGNWLAFGTSSACDWPNSPDDPPSPRSVSKGKAIAIWVIIGGSSFLILLLPPALRPALDGILIGLWLLGTIWQYIISLQVRKNRKLQVAVPLPRPG